MSLLHIHIARLLLAMLLLTLAPWPNLAEAAPVRTKRATSSSKPSTSAKRAVSSAKRAAPVVQRAKGTKKRAKKSTRKKRRRAVRIQNTPITKLVVVRERELAQGVRYVEYRTNGKQSVNVHVMTVDRTVPGNALRLVKGLDQADGLERLADMSRRYHAVTGHSIHGLVNGNFWRSYRNTPIGACVIDGEVVEMNPYKKWTSAFFDVKNELTIDTFTISGSLTWAGRTFSIASVNRRIDSGVVLYNVFGGPTVPNVNAAELQQAFQEALKDTVFSNLDSTETALSQERLRMEIAAAQRESNVEFPRLKVRVRYLRSPSLNVPLHCQVLGADTGTAEIPIRGAVLSFPRSAFASTSLPRKGDTITVHFTTNIMPTVRFMNALCGTPRLVRNGVAKHEASKEGSTGRRFIAQNLARTALGVDKSGTKIIVASMESSKSQDATVGATLQQTADVMRLLGCYQAMNLDGGGSAGMLVDGDHVFFEGEDPLTRRISVGLAVVRLSHVLRTQTPTN